MKLFNTSSQQRILIKFFLTWALIFFLDYWSKADETNLKDSLIYGFIFALTFALIDEVMKNVQSDNIAYINLKNEKMVLERLEQMGFVYSKTKNDVVIYSKSRRLMDDKIKLVKTSYTLKVIASESNIKRFEEFV